jgi:hypothetical protein
MGQGWCLIHHLKSRRGKRGKRKADNVDFRKMSLLPEFAAARVASGFSLFSGVDGAGSLNYERLISFLYFKGCYIPAAPYNALPLTRQM